MVEVRTCLEAKERAVLVGVEWTSPRFAREDAEASLAELEALARTAGVEVCCEVLHRQNHPVPATFLSKGKVEEIRLLNEELRATLFLFDEELTPAQIRNLEKTFEAKVLDRRDLILDIFAQRARTLEAKLQVELAQLETALPRLTRQWTHLSRLGGGSGVGGGVGTRGPGETQLQLDRQWIRSRIVRLRSELREIVQHREVQRKGREGLFSVALVGYTNAGKSSLLNALAGAPHAHTEDKLFATLDPLTRLVRLPDGREFVLSDTVGFIRRLPHHLVAAFRATLEEVTTADLLLHVVDASHPEAEKQIAAVQTVLQELHAETQPTLMIFNKADRVDDPDRLRFLCEPYDEFYVVSARTGEGLDALREALSRRVSRSEHDYVFRFALGEGKWLSYLYEHGLVREVKYGEKEMTVRVLLDPRFLKPLKPYLILS